jgi:Homeodomain-like domain
MTGRNARRRGGATAATAAVCIKPRLCIFPRKLLASVLGRKTCKKFGALVSWQLTSSISRSSPAMRGRRPNPLTIWRHDHPILLRLAHSQTSPWFQVQRARIVLAIADGQRTEAIASQMQCEETTVWRACQRYRRDGLAGLLADGRANRSGRPASISPPPARPNRRVGVSGARRPRAAHHSLVA